MKSPVIFRILMITLGLIAISSYLGAQDLKSSKSTFLPEVDSIYNNLKDSGINQILVYYFDGAVKKGLILWKSNESYFGIKFRKDLVEKIKIEKIKNRILKKYQPFEKYLQYASLLKNNLNENSESFPDFNLTWLYFNNNKADTTVVRISSIKPESDAASLFFLYDKIMR